MSTWNDPLVTLFTDPWTEIRKMRSDLRHLFESDGQPIGSRFWRPACDFKETNKEYVLRVELPGVNKEDIHVEMHKGILTIRGERKEEKKEENEKYHTVERSFGQFVRRVRVPEGVSEESVRAKFENGVLEVTIPKPTQETDTLAPKKIAIMSKL